MKRSAVQHSKVLKLARKVDRPRYVAIGILESLWQLTAREAPHGDIGKLTNEDIAAGIDWREDADLLIQLLVDTRLIDKSNVHRIVVHDWHDHCDEAVKKLVHRSGRPFASIHVATRDDKICLPEPEPEPEPEPSPKHGRRTGRVSVDAVDSIYQAYPRHIKPRAAKAAIEKAIRRVEMRDNAPADPAAWLLDRTRAYATSPAGTQGQYTPHPATWFNADQFDDDVSEWVARANGQPRSTELHPDSLAARARRARENVDA